MQPAVGVHGHRLPPVLLHVRGLGGLLQELQQALDPHGAAHAGPGKPEAFAGPPEDPGGGPGSLRGDETAPTAAGPARRGLAAGGKGRPRRCPRGGRTGLSSSARSAFAPPSPRRTTAPGMPREASGWPPFGGGGRERTLLWGYGVRWLQRSVTLLVCAWRKVRATSCKRWAIAALSMCVLFFLSRLSGHGFTLRCRNYFQAVRS